MIQLFFIQDGKPKFLEISSETYERLLLYRHKRQVTIGHIVDRIFAQYGNITEELIIQYLD